MSRYRHLTDREREQIAVGLALGKSQREIGKQLGRDHRTVGREIKRNAKYFQKYVACKAHKRAKKRAKKQRQKAPLKEPAIFLYVRERLRKGWSPETIAGRLPIDHPGKTISHETIYRYIYKKENRRYKLWQKLPLARKKRKKKGGRRVQRRGKIPGAVSIELRPKRVGKRKEVGHWESDNIEGKRTDQTVVSVEVERATRYTKIGKLQNRGAAAKTRQVLRLANLPDHLKLSLTVDNGKENSYHHKISQHLNLPVYFCHAYSSWEKGTVENTIGRIRRYIPKGYSLDQVEDYHLKAIEQELNHTPRKCLQYLTPQEKMDQYLDTS